VKIKIERCERWPDYGFYESCGYKTEISEELWERYKRVVYEYNKIQDELEKVYNRARH